MEAKARTSTVTIAGIFATTLCHCKCPFSLSGIEKTLSIPYLHKNIRGGNCVDGTGGEKKR
jgi:hypothetical protein